MNNNFIKDLNTTLINSHYPHLANKLFNNLTLPYGLMINKPNINNCKTFTICNANECLDDNIHDKLVSLVEIKKDSDNKVKKLKSKSTRKKKKKKREKTTRKK
tara:strand:+ start:1016 stop:1324 length:309 start_codon:yes stop_codon:yes gene_type:complete